jgi:ABC-type multidrug transport system ATPase subunit
MKTPRDRPAGLWKVAAAGAEGLTVFEASVAFGEAQALRAVSLRVARGEVVALFGPNGAGKSTLIRSAAGLLPLQGGKILIDGVDLAASAEQAKRNIGWLPDTPLFYDELTALENLVFFARLWGMPGAEAHGAAKEALGAARLLHRAADRAGELSHGMRQRLSLARATLHRPAVLLLDEPFEGLDAASAADLVGQLQDASLRAGRAVLLATHRAELALSACDRVALLHRGELVRVAARGEVDAAELGAQLRRLGGEPHGK